MSSRKIVSRILPFFIIIFGLSCFSSRQVVQPVLPIDDTAIIRIDPTLRAKHPRDARCLDALVKEMLADSDGIFRQPMFSAFLGSSATRLVLTEKRLPRTKGDSQGHTPGLTNRYLETRSFSIGFILKPDRGIIWFLLSFTRPSMTLSPGVSGRSTKKSMESIPCF
jgi:hypothetical protein